MHILDKKKNYLSLYAIHKSIAIENCCSSQFDSQENGFQAHKSHKNKSEIYEGKSFVVTILFVVFVGVVVSFFGERNGSRNES